MDIFDLKDTINKIKKVKDNIRRYLWISSGWKENKRVRYKNFKGRFLEKQKKSSKDFKRKKFSIKHKW